MPTINGINLGSAAIRDASAFATPGDLPDQDVNSGASPVFDGTNFTNVPAGPAPALAEVLAAGGDAGDQAIENCSLIEINEGIVDANGQESVATTARNMIAADGTNVLSWDGINASSSVNSFDSGNGWRFTSAAGADLSGGVWVIDSSGVIRAASGDIVFYNEPSGGAEVFRIREGNTPVLASGVFVGVELQSPLFSEPHFTNVPLCFRNVSGYPIVLGDASSSLGAVYEIDLAVPVKCRTGFSAAPVATADLPDPTLNAGVTFYNTDTLKLTTSNGTAWV